MKIRVIALALLGTCLIGMTGIAEIKTIAVIHWWPGNDFLCCADIDGDGTNETLVSGYDGQTAYNSIRVIKEGSGDYIFYPLDGARNSCASSLDFDGDGRDEVIIGQDCFRPWGEDPRPTINVLKWEKIA